jgi:hypothetical protein
MKKSLRVLTFLVTVVALAPTARAEDASMDTVRDHSHLKVLSTIKLMARPGDSISAGRSHHHDYIYVAHVHDQRVDIIDVSDPAMPREINRIDAKQAVNKGQTTTVRITETGAGTARVLDLTDPNEPRVVADFPDAISATSDRRRLIYVLDRDSLRVLAPKEGKTEKQQEDDSWFRNAMTPG